MCLFNHQLDRLKTLLPLLITVCVNNPSIYLNSGMASDCSLCLVDLSLQVLDGLVKLRHKLLSVGGRVHKGVLGKETLRKGAGLEQREIACVCTRNDVVVLKFQLKK